MTFKSIVSSPLDTDLNIVLFFGVYLHCFHLKSSLIELPLTQKNCKNIGYNTLRDEILQNQIQQRVQFNLKITENPVNHTSSSSITKPPISNSLFLYQSEKTLDYKRKYFSRVSREREREKQAGQRPSLLKPSSIHTE